MKRIFLLLFLCCSCSEVFLGDDPHNTPEETFELFWKGVDSTWPEFETKKVNWDSLYDVYRPRVNSETSESDLISAMQGLMYNLKDGHTSIYPKGRPEISYYPKYPKNFYGFDWIRKNYLFITKGNRAIGYGKINADIGYIYVGTFGGDQSQFNIIDVILKEFASMKAVIIDVRSNGGGSSNNAKIIASRFADQSRDYSYVRHRLNEQRTQMSDFLAASIHPEGTVRFTGKVAVLTNRYSFSATEDFILMMRSFPQTILIGDNTGGGSGSRPLFKELPNGWGYRVSSMLTCDLTKTPISKGIEPHLSVATSKTDSLANKDSILEKAVLELSR